ncbi:MAG: peroxidase-related enzyme [Saprospiraceae bacterium]|nr:peroxidase-related enzyme [Saprospiraceae bacterium]
MAYIELEKHLPGITGLLEYRQDTAQAIRDLTEILMCGPSSLTKAEREIIATFVSSKNKCTFCTAAHAAVVDALLDESLTCAAVIENYNTAPISPKLKALLVIAEKVQQNGKLVTESDILRAKELAATDLEIHDTVLISALFCLYNKYVDGLSTYTPVNPEFYQKLGEKIKDHGYHRVPSAYEKMKEMKFD